MDRLLPGKLDAVSRGTVAGGRLPAAGRSRNSQLAGGFEGTFMGGDGGSGAAAVRPPRRRAPASTAIHVQGWSFGRVCRVSYGRPPGADLRLHRPGHRPPGSRLRTIPPLHDGGWPGERRSADGAPRPRGSALVREHAGSLEAHSPGRPARNDTVHPDQQARNSGSGSRNFTAWRAPAGRPTRTLWSGTDPHGSNRDHVRARRGSALPDDAGVRGSGLEPSFARAQSELCGVAAGLLSFSGAGGECRRAGQCRTGGGRLHGPGAVLAEALVSARVFDGCGRHCAGGPPGPCRTAGGNRSGAQSDCSRPARRHRIEPVADLDLERSDPAGGGRGDRTGADRSDWHALAGIARIDERYRVGNQPRARSLRGPDPTHAPRRCGVVHSRRPPDGVLPWKRTAAHHRYGRTCAANC